MLANRRNIHNLPALLWCFGNSGCKNCLHTYHGQWPLTSLHSATCGQYVTKPTMLPLPSQPQSVTTRWLIPSYTALWQRQTGVSSLPKATAQWCPAGREPATYDYYKSDALPTALQQHPMWSSDMWIVRFHVHLGRYYHSFTTNR